MRNGRDRSFDENYSLCLERLNWAIEKLGGHPDPEQISMTAEMIIQTMSGAWRFFHTPEHIFEVGESGDAIEVLSALFHDSIYVQVDVGVSVNIGRKIAPFVKETRKSLTILKQSQLSADPVFEIICRIFGFTPGQTLLPSKGQNEFLSAVVAGRCLEHALAPAVIAQIAACIESTIPFRPKSESEQRPCEHLRARMALTGRCFGFGWNDSDLDMIVQRAVRLANRDVENFSHESSAVFLDNTWNLMPETNHDLIGSYSYTVSGYRLSLQKMENFMSFLTPDVVFQFYQDEPCKPSYEALLARTHKNLAVARVYLGSKLLSIAVIEAISRRLGTDIPLATMMGELPLRGLPEAQMECFLPVIEIMVAPEGPLEQEVLALLEIGRTKESDYDVKNSPVAAFIVKSIGFPAALQLLTHAKEFFQENLSGEEFLGLCNPDIVETIVESVLAIFSVRVAALEMAVEPPAIAVQATKDS